MLYRYRFVPLVLVLGFLLGSLEGVHAEGVMNVVMEDQFQTPCETTKYLGDVVILVYAERRGAEESLLLGRKLHLHFHPTADEVSSDAWSKQPVRGIVNWPAGVALPDVRVIPVASLTEVPRALKPVARARMRKDSPVVPIWLDFDGTLKRMFGIIPGEPNIVVLNTAGQVHSVLSGKLNEHEFQQFVTRIDHIRSASRDKPRVVSQPQENILR
ncbi:MAG TPA: hypothetical protein DEB70_09790 [Planctomycetaceae bacterium]|nr:hypothetical protein [Planctomycetaceae bacterium]